MYVCNCKNSKNKYAFNLSFFLLSALSFVPLFPTCTTYTTITTTIICLVHYSLHLHATTVLFTRNFTQGWLHSYWLSSALPCLFKIQHDDLNERSEVDGWRICFLENFIATTCICTFSYSSVRYSLMIVVIVY